MRVESRSFWSVGDLMRRSGWLGSHPSAAGRGWWSRYAQGALANARLVDSVFPGWKLRIYHDLTTPPALLDELRAITSSVQLINVSVEDEARRVPNPRAWRFAVASDPSVSRWLVRDAFGKRFQNL